MEAASTNMRPLLEDTIHYEKSLKAFKDYSGEKAVYDNWYQTKFEQLVVNKIKEPEQDLRVLGIGSGAGEADLEMLKKLQPKYPQIHTTIVEPSDEAIGKFRQLVAFQQTSLPRVVFDWRQQTHADYQQHCQQNGDVTKFHFIHAIHCLYHVPDVSATVRALYESLEPGGVLLIIITSEKSGINNVHERFSDLQEKGAHHICKFIKTTEIQKGLEKRGVTSQIYPQALALDITKCFLDGDEIGDLLLDFLTHKKNFRQDAPRRLFEDYLGFLKEPQNGGTSGGKTVLNMDWDALLVYKS